MKVNINRVVIQGPTSAYEILRKVRELVLDEPKRMRMGSWCVADFKGTYGYLGSDWMDEHAPSCNTAACMAGWINHVVGSPYPIDSDRGMGGIAFVVGDYESEPYNEMRKNFAAGAHYYASDGSQEQANLVATFLDNFMAKWETHLKARIVMPGAVVPGSADQLHVPAPY